MAKSVVKDPEGVEFNLETGYGNVVKIEHEEGKRNASVEFKADNLRLPVKGWADTSNPDLWDVITDAKNTGRRVSFRIETHRKDEIDKTLPMQAVGQFDRFRRLVDVKAAQDAQNGSAAPTTAANGSQAQRAPENGSDGDPGPQDPNDYGHRPGASLGMVELAYKLITERLIAKGVDANPDPKKVKAVATMLLDACDSTQATVRADGRTDRMDNSHTRARGAVRSVVEATGVPFDSFTAPGGPEAWVSHLSTEAAALLNMAIELDARGVVPAKPHSPPDPEPNPGLCSGGCGEPSHNCHCQGEPF